MKSEPTIDWEKTESFAVELLQKLVSFDTTNPPGNEAPAIAIVRELLEQQGLRPTVVSMVENRPNLVVRIPGSGRGPSLMLDSHIDVVPADPEEWTVHPFSGHIRDGCIWGRGTLDMKHMTAMSLTVLLTILRQRSRLAGDLVVTVTSDEEDGAGKGAFFLADKHPELVSTDYALGEVGGMNHTINGRRLYPVQVAEKGLCWLRICVVGDSGHGSMPRTDSVPYKIARILARLERLRFPIAPHPAAKAFLEAMADLSGTANGVVLRLVKRGRGASFLIDRLVPGDKAPSLRAVLSHTCQPTTIRCGGKINVIPSQGEILVDCRMLPGMSPEQMKQSVEQEVGDLARVEFIMGHRGHATSMDNPLYHQIVKTISVMDPGAVVSPYLMPGFTNGGAYSALGVKYMGFTPVMIPPTMNPTALFHAPDERIPVDGFKWGVRTLYETVTEFLKVR